ncbi:uncharacterized protein JN550_009028 [Neoarthrinium moseri]|uniref:uncharacterized protein n=1 Tax=Neoarthrinium moseri TaxID=1658444 RepID=UPI001FDDB50B|nr:uncharacterized protein JN550_009028 [Neoarthrinium moseri]KAI1864008.1 hypothetical protein JN550_009028 [Neoarthrinium moseri]
MQIHAGGNVGAALHVTNPSSLSMAGLQRTISRGISALGLAARPLAVSNPGSLDALKTLCETKVGSSDYRRAKTVERNIPIYDLASTSIEDLDAVVGLQDEWYHALNAGPGVVVLKNFLSDHSVIKQANGVFDNIIKREAASTKGDHFAAAGSNSRVWNSFQKHAEQDPANFVHYYANPWLDRVSEAWLGPFYQITAQLNVVRPGGKPQSAHRDYHLGFQSADACALFPRSMQIASQYLTLQGGIAHSAVPLDSGPTRLLPFSQLLPEGYLAWRLPEFTNFFNERWVSLPMEIGDAVFFNPALFHAAGQNDTKTIERSVNLLQISSAFGRPMESVNNLKIIRKPWEQLKKLARDDKEGHRTAACVNAMAEGYPFPSNLDRRPPGPDGMAPISEVDILWEGLRNNWSTDHISEKLQQLIDDSDS